MYAFTHRLQKPLSHFVVGFFWPVPAGRDERSVSGLQMEKLHICESLLRAFYYMSSLVQQRTGCAVPQSKLTKIPYWCVCSYIWERCLYHTGVVSYCYSSVHHLSVKPGHSQASCSTLWVSAAWSLSLLLSKTCRLIMCECFSTVNNLRCCNPVVWHVETDSSVGTVHELGNILQWLSGEK